MILLSLLALVQGAASSETPTTEEIAAISGAWRAAHERQIYAEFSDLLSLPNYAEDSDDILRNAQFIADMLRERGLEPEIWQVDGSAPAVFAERSTPGATTTIVVYAHYDGQPVDADAWASPPFSPVLRDGRVEDDSSVVEPTFPLNINHRIFARSAGDDKAPIIAALYALEAMDNAQLPPSVNLKFFFEGEEEIGSPYLGQLLKQHADRLDADLWLFCDGPMHQSRRPQIAYGVRGATGFHVTTFGATRPLHSGHYGNWAPNPLAMMNHLMSSMRAEDGTVLMEGFYDEVREPTQAEMSAIDEIPRVDLALKLDLSLGSTEGNGERLEALLLRPALNFRGIQGGGVREKSRNAIATEVTASFGIRLVPDQSVEHLQGVVRRHLQSEGYFVVTSAPDPETLAAHEKVALLEWGNNGYRALRTPLDHPVADRLANIVDDWSGGNLVRLPTMGGSLPLFLIEETLDTPVIILPVANHDNNQHGANENLLIGNLWDAIDLYAVVFALLGRDPFTD